MDPIPPSYKSATDRDAWAIIAHYIPSSDLCAASLVCHRWHDLFMPFLWGDPASHFGTENDAVYVALTRFRRTLKYARREIRALTHTLHLPPALSEIYGGPRPGWLRDILEYLPCLQSLMVSRLPFFDHNAMTALRDQQPTNQYSVRLLLAKHEPNTTSAALAETLLRFPLLTYLDLSYTTSARDRSVLASLSQLEHLQVLKLRGIGLRDSDAEFLANAVGMRVRLLDIRNNLLTDMSVRSLLQASFLPRNRRVPPSSQSQLLESSDLDERLVKLLAQPFSNNPWIEDLPHTGITHLYIANNKVSVEGVASLLASSRLHAIDAGSVNTADMINEKWSQKHGRYPGAEKLVPLLGTVAGEKLVYLRAHHAVVTAEPPSKDMTSFAEFLPELPATEMQTEAELDASQEVHELPGDYVHVPELADTSAEERSTLERVNPSQDLLPVNEAEVSARRGSALAPEVVLNYGETISPRDLQAQSLPWTSRSSDYGTTDSIAQCPSPSPNEDIHAQRIQELLAKRPRNLSIPLRDGKESRFPYLHPSHIPHLETLVLTDVPSHILPGSPVLYTLTRFITACSNEALLATLQAGSDYSLPPGRARFQAEQRRSRSLFGLRRIILEITPTDTSRLTTWKPASQHNGVSNSSTGDRDSEALWAAATDDFSFFGEDECGVPDNDPGKYFPMAILNEKVSLMPSEDDSSGTDSPPLGHQFSPRSMTSAARTSTPPQMHQTTQSTLLQAVDIVAELAAFRRAKKAEYEHRVRRERGRRSTNGKGLSLLTTGPQISLAHFVEGHWKGEVKVIRNPAPKGRSGIVDMYGNYFEKGYLYP
ncbi:hypothetical protein N7492_004692 [Penicillium capsulatum]|uniref:F-box domain-containing protein n=1 Tax=Penicillium capsulatum TaxID=69766 RepID=A0A9W9IAC9_9EURO|nr:hypothetical protein N7492_004692 [Penicillium capsulatum]KAJ6136199.1 hypothetical protein N7512_001359 [Penicillium capsulatum]